MIHLNYILKTFREHVKFLIMALLMLGTLEFLIFMLVVEADFLNMAQIFIQKFPPIVQQYFNDQWLAQFSISGAGEGWDRWVFTTADGLTGDFPPQVGLLHDLPEGLAPLDDAPVLVVSTAHWSKFAADVVRGLQGIAPAQAAPNAGEGDELKVITAVIVGGASLAGGKGTVFGAFLGYPPRSPRRLSPA